MKRFAVCMAALTAGLFPCEAPALQSAPLPTIASHELTAADLDAWFDGLLTTELRRADIAGAVVVVVKDNSVLYEHGFGQADAAARRPVDPQDTLFRAGSVSKLFVWTSVMQLAQFGKVNLDADVNSYLDFRIPPFEGHPVTLRNLMTHTAGFEETEKGIFFASEKTRRPLGRFLKESLPHRVFAPGTVVAYSNYGAALAGYIVQRISGEPFEIYVARHIFAPLGMRHASFAQPLPPDLARHLSQGYWRASQGARAFELVGPSPAGALSISGDDMARFMIAHLNQGRYGDAEILSPASIRLMHAPAYRPIPPLKAMTLGFYEEDLNGHHLLGHAGDTELFHSDIHLLPDDHVGLFVSFNSAGDPGISALLRPAILRGFMDRYFPAPATPALPTLATASRDGALVAGRYRTSRREESNFPKLLGLLGQIKFSLDKDGRLVGGPDWNGTQKHWREIAPMLWIDADNRSRLAAKVEHGRVSQILFDDIEPVFVLQPVPFVDSAAWQLPLLVFTLATLLIVSLAWLVSGAVRRFRHRPFELSGRAAAAYRLSRAACVVALGGLLGWFVLIGKAVSGGLSMLDTPLDPWLYVLFSISLLGAIGVAASLWNLVITWLDQTRTKGGRLTSVLVVIAGLGVLWFDVSDHLISFSTHY